MSELPKPPSAIPFMIYGATIGMLLFGIFKLGQASTEAMVIYVDVPIIKSPEGPVKVRPKATVDAVGKCPPQLIIQRLPKRIDSLK